MFDVLGLGGLGVLDLLGDVRSVCANMHACVASACLLVPMRCHSAQGQEGHMVRRCGQQNHRNAVMIKLRSARIVDRKLLKNSKEEGFFFGGSLFS